MLWQVSHIENCLCVTNRAHVTSLAGPRCTKDSSLHFGMSSRSPRLTGLQVQGWAFVCSIGSYFTGVHVFQSAVDVPLLCRGKSCTSIGTSFARPAARAMIEKVPYCSMLGQSLRGASQSDCLET